MKTETTSNESPPVPPDGYILLKHHEKGGEWRSDAISLEDGLWCGGGCYCHDGRTVAVPIDDATTEK